LVLKHGFQISGISGPRRSPEDPDPPKRPRRRRTGKGHPSADPDAKKKRISPAAVAVPILGSVKSGEKITGIG